MFKKTLRLGALMVVSLASAAAATISFSDVVPTTFPSPLSFSLSQFNPALGSLTSVTIDFSAVLDGEFLAQNLSNSAGVLNGTMAGEFLLDGPAPLAMPLLTLSPTANFGPTPVGAGETVMFSILGATDSSSFSTSTPADFAAFLGLGAVMLDGSATASSSASGNFTPLLFSSDLSGQATLRITYEYDNGQVPDVPEPMTLYLMGGGLLALSLIRPKSRKLRL